MSTTVTSKGQVTIPKAVRDRLGIQPGSKVDIRLAGDGEAVLTRVDGRKKPTPSRFAKYVGFAGPGPTTDELMTMLRGDD
jgi:AbrB family looped-hinge helix DNA binding protein